MIFYTPNFHKGACDVPSNLDGAGSTIVIVDALGGSTRQADLNVYDNVTGLPPTVITILCGPTIHGRI